MAKQPLNQFRQSLHDQQTQDKLMQIFSTPSLTKDAFVSQVKNLLDGMEPELAWWIYQNQSLVGPFHIQVQLQNIPFTSNHTHKVDFYFDKLDLYVEVKGSMTLHEVHVLDYLLNHSGKNFYVFQATSEGWLPPYIECPRTDSNYISKPQKINQNIQDQLQELDNAFRTGNIGELVALGKKHLADYVIFMNEEVSRWTQVQSQLGPII